MKRHAEGRHPADHRPVSTGVRVKQFLRLARTRRETFHAHHPAPGSGRLVHFLRIARGRLA